MAEITGSFYGNTSGPASVVCTYNGDPSSLILLSTIGTYNGEPSAPVLDFIRVYNGDPSSLIIIPTVETYNGDPSSLILLSTVETYNGNPSGVVVYVGGGKDSGAAKRWVIGALQGISLGGPTSINGDGTFGRHLQVGVTQSMSDGNPAAPCLSLDIPGMWRFRWVVKAGTRTINVNVKQAGTIFTSSLRPTVVVKANPNIGLNTDISGSAVASQGWVTIGPISFIATTSGVTWVELHNNNTNEINTPTLFDHIVTT